MNGTKHSEETKEKMRRAAKARIINKPWTNVSGWNKGIKTSVKPPNYKGERASYSAHHHWVKYHFGKASAMLCVACGKQAQEWANLSGKYLRDFTDWVPMCIKCHRKKDDVIKKSWKTRKGQT